MTFRSQRGATTVELLVAMAVVSLVFTGLVGVIRAAAAGYNLWYRPLQTAATDPALEFLAASVQADSHTYVPCSTSAGRLDFCLPAAPAPALPAVSSPVVSYTSVSVAGGYQVVRGTDGGNSVVLRRLASAPSFHVTCPAGNSGRAVGEGTIRIAGLALNGPKPDVSVFFVGPGRECTSV